MKTTAFCLSMLLCASALSSCANNDFYAGMGHPVQQTRFEGGGPAAVLRATHHFDDRVSCSATHLSFWFTGAPMNNHSEDNVTILDCGLTFRQ